LEAFFMRKWFILLTAMFLLVPSFAQAQGAVALDSLKVRLWPEFDQPSMLVLYDLTVTDDTEVPSSMELRFPSDANITAVAYESEGSLLLANYQTKPSDDPNWQVITLLITERVPYHIEYYQPLERDGDKRSFTYQWTGEYPVSNFAIELQLPVDSTNVRTDPVIPIVQEASSLSGGAVMSGLEAGQVYKQQLEYSRSSEVPVSTPVSSQVEPTTPVDENTDGRSTLDNLPLILGGFGVALIIIAGLVYFLRGQSTKRTSKPRKRSRDTQSADVQTYCHECGARAQEGDRFCRACGSKFR
jgi:hypothetical protein